VTERACGECTACCKAIGVVELGKLSWQDCRHRTWRGCRRYRKRPLTCRQYACLWLLGLGNEGDRPDKLGVIFSTDVVRDSLSLNAWQVIPGSMTQPRVMQLLRAAARHTGLRSPNIIAEKDDPSWRSLTNVGTRYVDGEEQP
jgi:hypothetical protein